MTLFNIFAIVITFAAILSYLNLRYVRLPNAIGLMFISLLASIGLLILGKLFVGIERQAYVLLQGIDFQKILLQGMLGFLLFAGALHVNLNDLLGQKGIISLLATFGLACSTAIIGALCWIAFSVIGLEVSFVYCLLFGALISPTDPIAVMAILKTAGAPKSVETKIVGESLFNDGVGVVLFLVLLSIASGAHEINVWDIGVLLGKGTLGGIVLGLITGGIAFLLLKSVENYHVEILITIALVMGSYAIGDVFHFSGPIAVVVAGLLIGNHGRLLAMSEETRVRLDMFWETIDEILNTILFVLIGLEVLVLTLLPKYIAAGLLAIPIVLLARFISAGIPVLLLKPFRPFSRNIIRILTWSGIRGGISVAMVLSLPPGHQRDLLLVVTYLVVISSIAVQGLTVGKLVRRSYNVQL